MSLSATVQSPYLTELRLAMVVNRKQPSIPVPPAPISRSSSTQPVPTKRTKNAPKPTPLHNGREIDSRKPAKPPVEPTKHKTKKRRSLIDRLFLVSLSLFAFYTFYTCRPNPLFTSPPSDPSNPLCLSLSAYSTHVLEPYVLPPLKHSLSTAHTLAEPYIAQSKTHLAPYVAPVVRTSRTLKPYITRAVSTSKHLWTNTLLPYWRTAVVPRYQKHIRPRLVPLANTGYKYYRFYVLNPLHIQAARAQAALHTLYTTYLGQYVAKVQPHVQQAWNSLHTVSSRAYQIYHAHVHPRLVDGWVAARPVLCEVWKHVKAFTLRASEVGATQLKRAGKEAVTLRRTYVDPQVRKIWDKVAESTPGPVSSTSTSQKKLVSSTPANKPAATTVNADSPDPSPEEAPEDELASSTGAPTPAHPSTDTPTSSPEDQDEKHREEEAQHAVSIAEASAHGASTVVAELEREVAESVHVHMEPTAVPIDDPSTASPETHTLTEAPTPTPSSAQPTEDEDLDDFLRDIGVNSDSEAPTKDDPSADPSDSDIAPQEPTLPEETPEEALARIAAKRLDITTRHAAWFVQLDEATSAEKAALPGTLAKLREEKAKEMDEMRKKGQAGVLAGVEKEGGKLVKGLEGYLKKAEGRNAGWKVAEDGVGKEEKKAAAGKEKEKWTNVLNKVEEKFSERVRTVQADVHAWYLAARELEGDEVRASAYKIKNLAERAQADLGLDYAWLEDVTYDDWQRYHDLVRVYEDWEQAAWGIQGGASASASSSGSASGSASESENENEDESDEDTDADSESSTPVPDPVVLALDKLDAEMQDVVLGFQVALTRLRSEASSIFSPSNTTSSDGEEHEEDSGFFVVQDGQTRKDDLRGVELGSIGLSEGMKKKVEEGAGIVGVRSPDATEEEKEEEQVEILPIDPPEDRPELDAGEEKKELEGPDASNVKQGKEEKVEVIFMEHPHDRHDLDAEEFDASKIVIGKDKVTVEQALKDVPLVSVPPKAPVPEQPVEPVKSEPVPQVAPQHVEL